LDSLAVDTQRIVTPLDYLQFEPAATICIDFETFYDQEYQLRKLTTEAYVRDPRFETVGVGVGFDDRPSMWLEDWQFRQWAPQLDWSQVAVLSHKTHFDGLILAHHYGIRPGFWLDTLSMSRALNGTSGRSNNLDALMQKYGVGKKGTFGVETDASGKMVNHLAKAKGKRRKDFTQAEWLEYGEYCKTDVDGCRGIFWHMAAEFPESELWVIDTVIRMFTEPKVVVHEELLKQYVVYERKRKAALLDRIEKDRTIVGSNEKFAALLVELGEDPHSNMKVTPQQMAKWKESDKSKPPVETFAFAKSDSYMQGLLEHPDEMVRWAAEARIAIKSNINETRSERFLRAGAGGRAVPVYLNFSAAHTHRFGGGDRMNWQNLERTNKKKPEKGIIRKAVYAPAGWKIVAADSGAIEARGVAWLAGHRELLEGFVQKRDIYSELATVFYGRQIDRKKNPEDEIPGIIGKTACLAASTLVLTDRGWLPIVGVRSFDLVWDGVEWVNHGGLLDQGEQVVWEKFGVAATPDHKILCIGENTQGKCKWFTWSDLVGFQMTLFAALEAGASTPDGFEAPVTALEERTYSTRTTRVYDLLNAGPRARFTIWSTRGPLIVSNCLGLGYSMGWYKFAETLLKGPFGADPIQFTMKEAEEMGVNLARFVNDDDQMDRLTFMKTRLDPESLMVHCAVAQKVVYTWRNKNKPIVNLWGMLGHVIEAMAAGEELTFGPGECLQTVRHGIRLPNGLFLRYPGLAQGDDGFTYLGGDGGKQRVRIYGGSLTENIVQALARIIVIDQMLMIRGKYGYPIVTTTHDEVVAMVPQNEAERAKDRMLAEMKTPPAWAAGWPLAAEGGYAQCYGEAK